MRALSLNPYRHFVATALLILRSAVAFAGEPSATDAGGPSKSTRESMAAAHEKMASLAG